MKTAISLPDEVFAAAEALAKAQDKSRSELYVDALKAYLAKHDDDAVIEAYNKLSDEADADNAFVRRAARKSASGDAW